MIELDFTNKNLWVLFEWKGEPYFVTQSMLATWIVMALLIILAIVVRIRLKNFSSVPKGFQNIIESAVEAIDNMTKTNVGQRYDWFGGFFFSVFAFILLSNYSGLFFLTPPTSDVAVAAGISLSIFVISHIMGIIKQKGKYFKSYVTPNPVFLPINLIGEISKPLSHTFRLFGNIFGGVIIMALVYELLPKFLLFVFPDFLHLYFDIFAGALQAYIFTILSMSYIQQKVTTD